MPAFGNKDFLVHRVIKRLPPAPTVANIRPLVRPPASHAEAFIHSAYVIPAHIAPLLDCFTDSPADAKDHLDSLGVRPVWRTNHGDLPTREAQAGSAAKALAPRLRSAADASVIVLLFSQTAPGTSRTARARAARAQAASTEPGPEAVPAASEAARSPLPADGSTPRQRPSSCMIRPSSAASSSVTDAASLTYMAPLSRPMALQPRRSFVECGGGGGAQVDELSPHEGRSDGTGRVIGEEVRAEGSDEEDAFLSAFDGEDAFDIDELYPDAAVAAVAAARKATRCVWGPSKLHSQHTLPTAGNWVRLSAGQQYVVTRTQETGRRRAASAAHTQGSFGSEQRLSGSCTWAHQTTSQRLVGMPQDPAANSGRATSCGAAPPGSFLPLKACLSTLHGRAGSAR